MKSQIKQKENQRTLSIKIKEAFTSAWRDRQQALEQSELDYHREKWDREKRVRDIRCWRALKGEREEDVSFSEQIRRKLGSDYD